MQSWQMREFLFPEQHATYLASNERPLHPQLCVFCLKKNAFMHYCMLLWQHQDARVILQPYRNACDVPGEFAASMCLRPHVDRFYGIIAPFACHNLTMYTMENDPTTGLMFAKYTSAVYFQNAPVVDHASPQ
jgi:hypothetical protein